MKNYKTIKSAFCICVVAGICFAAIKGPQYYGLRSMGMGNTTVAVTTDRTAIFHNPAGLSLLKDKIEISISPLILSIDGKFIRVLKAMAEHGDKLTDLSKIDSDFIEMLNDLDGEWVGFEYIPEITAATKNLGFGIYTVLPIGVRIESGHLIPKLGLRGQRDLVFTWAVGVPLKTQNTHLGISVEYLQRTPLEETITTYSQTFNYFNEISEFRPFGAIGDLSRIQHGVSFDVGMMHNIKGFRIAYDIRDILGVIGGKIVAPPRIDLGCAYFFPQMEKVKYIDNLILAFEFSDVFGIEPVSEKYEHPVKKLHFGAELDLHYAAIRVGLNQGYPTAGLGLRFGIFCCDYVFFTEETGYYPGQLPKRKHVLSIGVGFKVKRPQREKETGEPEPLDESIETPEAKKQLPMVPETIEEEEPVPLVPEAEETVEQEQETAVEETIETTEEESEEFPEETSEESDEGTTEEDIGWE